MVKSPSVFAERDPAISVVNTGMGANGNGRWIKFLRAEGLTYQPQAVIIQLMGNDFSDNAHERLFELSADKELIELPVPPIETIRVVQNFVDRILRVRPTHIS